MKVKSPYSSPIPRGSRAAITSFLTVLAVFMGQSLVLAQELNEDTIRVKYEGSLDIPDGVTFSSLLVLIDHYIESDRKSFAVGWVADKLDLSIDQASEFVENAVRTAERVEADTTTEHYDLACMNGVPAAYNEDVYPVLQQMDAINIHVAERYLAQMKAGLEPNTALLLQQWVDDKKLNTTYIEIDHAKMAEISEGHSPLDLSEFCRLASLVSSGQ